MKLRKGFVSNSSSSSFVALMPKEYYKSILPDFDPLTTAIVGELSYETIFMGIDCVAFAYTSGNYSSLEEYNYDYAKKKILKKAKKISEQRGETFKADEDSVYGSDLYGFQKRIENDGKSFTHEEDF